MKATAIATPLVAAIEGAWSAIQANHDLVPDVVVTIGSGAKRGAMKLGHFAPHAWEQGENRVHELFVGAEGLALGAEQVMATLVHEAAHAWASAEGIQDVSRGGRYHNEQFKMIAETFGLELKKDRTLGWSESKLTEEAVLLYVDAILDLDLAITAHRRGPQLVPAGTQPTAPAAPGRGRSSSNNGVSATCGCGRRIRVAPSVLEAAPIVCGQCGEQFA